MTFKAGDTVKLKSGGPLMTVESVGETQFDGPGVWCVWFEKNTKKSDTFSPEVLEKAGKPALGVAGSVIR